MSLARRAASNIAWATATNLGSRVVALFGTVLMTRFIAPTEYGEVAVAVTIVHAGELFSSLGLLQYIVAKPESDRGAVFHTTVYYLALGLLGWMLMFWLGGPLVQLVDAPSAARFIPWVIAAEILHRVAVLPERVLWRDLRFAASGVGRSSSELVFVAVAVILAVRGWGGYAIVVGNIARYAVQVVVFSLLVERREWLEPCRLRWQRTRDLFRFGLPLVVGQVADNASQEWDNLLFSRLFGPRIVGPYNLAYNFADLPSTYIGEQVGDVLLPSFARAGPAQRKDGLVRALGLLTLLMAPIAFGMGAVAPTAVGVLFDARWAVMAPMLMMLAGLPLARPLGWTINAYLQATDRPRLAMVGELLKITVLFAAIITLAPHGPVWSCAAVSVAFFAHAVVTALMVHSLDGISLRRLVLEIGPPALACVPMVAAVKGVQQLFGGPSVVALLLEVLVGVAVFVPAGLLLAPRVSRDLLRLLLQVLRRRR